MDMMDPANPSAQVRFRSWLQNLKCKIQAQPDRRRSFAKSTDSTDVHPLHPLHPC